MSESDEKLNKMIAEAARSVSSYRDRVHNLDLNNVEEFAIYETELKRLMTHGESIKLTAYRDENPNSISKDGYNTIGIGFNMDNDGARAVWAKTIGDNPTFDDAYNKKYSITEQQAIDLYTYKLVEHRGYLKNSYGQYWPKLKPNERAAIEMGYYNIPKEFSGNSYLGTLVKTYIDDPSDINLAKAVEHIKQISNNANKFVRRGLKKRRAMEAEIFNSTKCPVRSRVGEPPIPNKIGIANVKLGETILPRKKDGSNDDCVLSDQYYIWYATIDEKTRPEHMEQHGKVFDAFNPPAGGNPGEAPNCRCIADFYIPKWVYIHSKETVKCPINNAYIIRKYIPSVDCIPNFMIK